MKISSENIFRLFITLGAREMVHFSFSLFVTLIRGFLRRKAPRKQRFAFLPSFCVRHKIK